MNIYLITLIVLVLNINLNSNQNSIFRFNSNPSDSELDRVFLEYSQIENIIIKFVDVTGET